MKKLVSDSKRWLFKGLDKRVFKFTATDFGAGWTAVEASKKWAMVSATSPCSRWVSIFSSLHRKIRLKILTSWKRNNFLMKSRVLLKQTLATKIEKRLIKNIVHTINAFLSKQKIIELNESSPYKFLWLLIASIRYNYFTCLLCRL